MNRLDEIEARLDALEKQNATLAASLVDAQTQAKTNAEQLVALNAVLTPKPKKAS